MAESSNGAAGEGEVWVMVVVEMVTRLRRRRGMPMVRLLIRQWFAHVATVWILLRPEGGRRPSGYGVMSVVLGGTECA